MLMLVQITRKNKVEIIYTIYKFIKVKLNEAFSK